MSVPERKYAMTMLEPGDWLCPSNDAQWLYRFQVYDEDGSAEGGDGPIVGQFWAVARIAIPDFERYPEITEDVDRWQWRAYLLRTRREAIDVMLQEAP